MILYGLLALNMLFELFITTWIFRNEAFILEQLDQMYHVWHPLEFKRFFESITLVSITFNSAMYLFGFFTVFSHKVTNYTVFSMLMIMSIFFGILLTYLNVLNIIMFILKCFTYVYTRFVLSQLYTVLMVPAAQNLQNMYNLDTFNN